MAKWVNVGIPSFTYRFSDAIPTVSIILNEIYDITSRVPTPA